VSSPAIQFKGSGWYITDYARKVSSPDGAKAESSSDGAEKSEKPAAEKTTKTKKSKEKAGASK
jgi:hypothetical protein